jgi:hypothetical protein
MSCLHFVTKYCGQVYEGRGIEYSEVYEVQ